MKNNNRKAGNSFERKLAQTLFDNGFWVHLLTQNQAGQPADLIAAKNRKTYLIDCKECSGNGFPLSRVEPNQQSAMSLWKDRSQFYALFAIKLKDDSIWMVNASSVQSFVEASVSSMSEDSIKTLGDPVEEWVRM